MRRAITLAAAALATCAFAAPAGADQHASVPFSIPDDPPPQIDAIPLHNMTIKRGQNIVLSFPYTCHLAACDVRIGPRDGSAKGARGDFNPFLAVRAQLSKGEHTTLRVRVQVPRTGRGRWFFLLAEQYLDGSRHYTDGTHDEYTHVDRARVTIRGTYFATPDTMPNAVDRPSECVACGAIQSASPVETPHVDGPPPVAPAPSTPPASPVDVPADAITVEPTVTARPNPVLTQPGAGSCLACSVQLPEQPH